MEIFISHVFNMLNMVGEKRRGVTKKDIADLKRKIKELQKEIDEIKTAFYEYTSEPYKAVMEFFGISRGERVLTKEGLGVGYVEATEKIKKSLGEKEKTE